MEEEISVMIAVKLGVKLMKTFTNKKGTTFVFVDVPEDYQTGKCYANQFNYWTEKHPYDESLPTLVWLPKGNYQLIGLAKDVSEELADDIVDENDELSLEGHGFKDYLGTSICDTPLESLQSLTQSLGLTNAVILKLIK